jgi:hypothetical protein
MRINPILLALPALAIAVAGCSGTGYQPSAGLIRQVERIAPNEDLSHLTNSNYAAIDAMLHSGDDRRGRKESDVRAYIRAQR